MASRCGLTKGFSVRSLFRTVRVRRQRGASAIEYAVLAALVSILVFVAGHGFGVQLPALFSTSTTVAGDAISGSPGRAGAAPGQTGVAAGLVGNANAGAASNAASNASSTGVANSGSSANTGPGGTAKGGNGK